MTRRPAIISAGVAREQARRAFWLASAARRWEGVYDHLSEDNCARVIDWARATAARETAEAPPRTLKLRRLPRHREMTGLPLFDVGATS